MPPIYPSKIPNAAARASEKIEYLGTTVNVDKLSILREEYVRGNENLSNELRNGAVVNREQHMYFCARPRS